MPPRFLWTDAQDQAIRHRRAQAQSWDSIASHLAVSRGAAIGRGRHLGARLPAPVRPDPEAEALADPDRPPLPAGHPHAWAILTAGTTLAGTAYCVPPPPDGDA